MTGLACPTEFETADGLVARVGDVVYGLDPDGTAVWGGQVAALLYDTPFDFRAGWAVVRFGGRGGVQWRCSDLYASENACRAAAVAAVRREEERAGVDAAARAAKRAALLAPTAADSADGEG